MPVNLFVAVVPPADALAPLVAAVERLRPQHPGLGWVAPSRWHLTLAFLGPGDVSDELLARLARVATRHPPAVLSLAGAGRFGDRVLWARVAGELGPLARAATRAGERAGFPVEDRPYRAHLTLARGRRQRIDLRPLVAALSDVAGPPWTAAEIVLMRSAQPEYERLAAWPLSGH